MLDFNSEASVSGTPEGNARKFIDQKLIQSGWLVQTYRDMNLAAGPGLAITEFPGAHGPADYLLYVDAKAIGVVEAKAVGHTLRGVEGQSASYSDGLPPTLPAWRRPLPFQYESTGEVTQFTNWIEALATSGRIFSCRESSTSCMLLREEMRARNSLYDVQEPTNLRVELSAVVVLSLAQQG
jgi:type I restriction enzyme R subunit